MYTILKFVNFSTRTNCLTGKLSVLSVLNMSDVKLKKRVRGFSYFPSVVVLGNGAIGAPSSVIISSGKNRYLVNCGEGTLKLGNEYKLGLEKIKHVFITSPLWKNISGVLSLTLSCQKPNAKEFIIHGHSCVQNIFYGCNKFVKLRYNQPKIKEYKHYEEFSNDDISVKCVFIYSSSSISSISDKEETSEAENDSLLNAEEEFYKKFGKQNSTHSPKKSKKRTRNRSSSKTETESFKSNSKFVFSYIFQTKSIPGTLLREKCVELGVPPGPLLGMLKHGKDVTLSDGKVVKSADVKNPDQPGTNIIVVECPTTEYLESLLNEPIFNNYQSGENITDLVIHFSSSQVVKNTEYQKWIKRFPERTKHLFLNENNELGGSVGIHRLQFKLNYIQPSIFPLFHDIKIPDYPREQNCNTDEGHILLPNPFDISEEPIYSDPLFYKCGSNSFINGETMCSLELNCRSNYDYSKCLVLKKEEFLREMFENDEKNEISMFKKKLEDLEHTLEADKRIYPKIVFLGTGSSKPSKVRNASGILIFLEENNCIIFDCGESTYNQLIHFYGSKRVAEILRNLNAIYVSHLHVDHHMGLITLLKARKHAFDEQNESNIETSKSIIHQPEFQPIHVLAPLQIRRWLSLYSDKFEDISELFNLLPNSFLEEDSKDLINVKEECMKILNLSSLVTAPVWHCPGSFGISIVHKNGCKITYSGDTRPCEALVKIGMESDILIHEATFENASTYEAKIKMHSTTGQAIKIGKKMNAKHILLTHFSQRYCYLPVIENYFKEIHIGIAFDFMEVPYNKLPLLPELHEPLKIIFSEFQTKMTQGNGLSLLRKKRDIANLYEENSCKSTERSTKIMKNSLMAVFTPLKFKELAKRKKKVMGDQGVPLKNMTDVGQILRRWEDEHSDPEYDPIPVLSRLAEIVETEIEAYMKMDPDPFDERHPSRADPNCNLGHVLKVIFKKDAFMNKLVNDYLRDNYWSRLGNTDKDDRQLNIAACRLVLDVMPGLETSAVFQTPDTDSLILRLFNWAEKAIEPLQSYAIGLLAAAMEVQDTAAAFREQNAHLVPIMLKRLHRLQEKAALERQQSGMSSSRPFAHLNQDNSSGKKNLNGKNNSAGGSPNLTSPPLMSPPSVDAHFLDRTPVKINGVVSRLKKDSVNGEVGEKMELDFAASTPQKNVVHTKQGTPAGSVITSAASECSNSSWAEMESFVIANISIHPLTLPTRQMLILRYLTPMGEYQEFLSHIFEHNALSLILKYTNIRETKETRLGFEALKYLAALLCHKKISIEFINMGGLKSLLEVPRPSVAATGVSICLYYLSYCEDAMERVCLLPHYIISELVSYALWLLERSHNSGRCHATMFFGLSFQFRVILEEFDAQDGLRKLYNVISTLPILSVEDEVSSVLNEDEECSYRQIVRHVTVALKRYYEAHLYIKAEQLRRAQDRDSGEKNFRTSLPSYKACRGSPEEVQAQIETLLELMPFNAPWPCVDELLRLGGITLLLQIIAFTYDWNFSGRAETVHSALNVLAICAVRPKVQLVFCDRLELPDDAMTIGMNIILGASEGEIVADPDVQKAALQVIINCVCAPIHRVGICVGRYPINGSAVKRKTCRSSEELIQKMWESVRENNGIIVLLMLMMIKTPITDADSIRALACRALAGLARCEKVRQIVSKLPVLSNGSMQVLLRDPILQEKRQEHVQFQKYYLELIEHITGKNQPTASDDISLPNIHRANVVAQTRIQYNKNQLYQLMYEQLMQDGLQEAAKALQKEANITPPPKQQLALHHKASPVPIRSRSNVFTPRALTFCNHSPAASNLSSNSISTPVCINSSVSSANCSINTSPHIKLNLANSRKDKMSPSVPTSYSLGNRSLQKQTNWDSSQMSALVTPSIMKSSQAMSNSYSHSDRITLDSIVTEYLTNQHALCKNPMVTCPQFNLFVPHKCPDPKSRNLIPNNFTTRFLRRQTGFRASNKMDNRLGHSRFCPVRTFRLNDEGGFFTCCEFLPCGRLIAMGTYQGEVWLYNLHTGAEEVSEQCHDSYLYNIQCNRRGDLMLTSSTWRRPLSALWGVSSVFVVKQSLQEEEYAEFSKVNQDRIVGTKASTATIYDIETGTSILTLSPRLSNTYSKNRATYNPTDELILTDGVLFDVNSGKEIHKFDKLNPVLSGVFHPNGLEIVSNTEIWDLRTFHLLRTVAALDHQHVLFSTPESALYTYSFEQENDEDTTFESSFKTLDSSDYSSIATIEVKKNVYHMACNKWDTQIAVVENVGEYHTVQESSVRLYDVGRIRDTEDDAEEEEEEDDMDGSEDGSNSQSGSDNDDNTENDNAGENNGDEANLEDLLNEGGENNEDDDDPEFVMLNSLGDSSSDGSDLTSASDFADLL